MEDNRRYFYLAEGECTPVFIKHRRYSVIRLK